MFRRSPEMGSYDPLVLIQRYLSVQLCLESFLPVVEEDAEMIEGNADVATKIDSTSKRLSKNAETTAKAEAGSHTKLK